MDLKRLVKVKDSDNKEQFAMKLLLSKKEKCPVTGKLYTIINNRLYVGGIERAILSNEVGEAVSQILSVMQNIKDSKKLTFGTVNSFSELVNVVRDEFDKNGIKDPIEEGSITLGEDGEVLCLNVATWGWESKIVDKCRKVAKRLRIRMEMSNDIVSFINPEVTKWMDSIYDKIDSMENALIYGKKPRVKLSKDDFDKFIRYTKLTSYLEYEDVDYNIVKRYLNS